MPLEAASIRTPATINSRIKIIKTTHEGKTCSSIKTTRAAKTRILSARGSINFPKSVISFRLLAKCPSTLSVIDKITKITSATQGFRKSRPPLLSIHEGHGDKRATTKTGTNNIRMIVTMFAAVQIELVFLFLVINSPY